MVGFGFMDTHVTIVDSSSHWMLSRRRQIFDLYKLVRAVRKRNCRHWYNSLSKSTSAVPFLHTILHWSWPLSVRQPHQQPKCGTSLLMVWHSLGSCWCFLIRIQFGGLCSTLELWRQKKQVTCLLWCELESKISIPGSSRLQESTQQNTSK